MGGRLVVPSSRCGILGAAEIPALWPSKPDWRKMEGARPSSDSLLPPCGLEGGAIRTPPRVWVSSPALTRSRIWFRWKELGYMSPGRWEAEMSPGSREEEKATTLSPGDHLFSARGPSEAAGLAEHPGTSPRFWWGSVVSYPAALHLDWRDTRLSLFHRCLAWARIERVWNGWTPGPRFSIAPPHSHWPSPRPPQSSLPLRPQCEEGARPGMNAFLL